MGGMEIQEVTPKKKARAIVSVAFSHEEFREVCQRAENAGEKFVSRYIRDLALNRIKEPPVVTSGISEGGTLSVTLH